MSTVPSNIIMLMNYVGFSQWLSIGATVLCLPYLRWKCPELDRPIRWEIIYKYNKSLTKIFDILQKYLYLLQNILYLTYYLRLVRVNLVFPVVYLAMTLVITVLPMLASPVETGIGLLMILTSVPVYLVLVRWVLSTTKHYLLSTYCRWRSKPRWLERLTTDTTNWLVRLLVVLPQQA